MVAKTSTVVDIQLMYIYVYVYVWGLRGAVCGARKLYVGYGELDPHSCIYVCTCGGIAYRIQDIYGSGDLKYGGRDIPGSFWESGWVY